METLVVLYKYRVIVMLALSHYNPSEKGGTLLEREIPQGRNSLVVTYSSREPPSPLSSLFLPLERSTRSSRGLEFVWTFIGGFISLELWNLHRKENQVCIFIVFKYSMLVCKGFMYYLTSQCLLFDSAKCCMYLDSCS